MSRSLRDVNMLELLGGCLFSRMSMVIRPLTSALRPQLNGRVGLGGVGVARQVHYEQGQSPKKGIREYFYYIDHQGMVREREKKKIINRLVVSLYQLAIVCFIFPNFCRITIFTSFQLFLDDARMKNFTSCFKGMCSSSVNT